MSTIVKFAPSSGHAIGAHLRLCLLWAVEQSYLPRPRRHVPTFYPGDGTGMLPFGRPYCSTCTLTADRGGKGPSPTALYGGGAERKLPVPCSHRSWRRYAYKGFNRRIIWFSYALPTQGRGPGFCSGPAYRGSGPKLYPKPMLTDLGDRKPTSPYLQSCRRTLPYALWLQHKTSAGSRPIVDFILTLSDECRD